MMFTAEFGWLKLNGVAWICIRLKGGVPRARRWKCEGVDPPSEEGQDGSDDNDHGQHHMNPMLTDLDTVEDVPGRRDA
jgi:hypothetical protein